MRLTEKQKRQLRKLGHGLKPCVETGAKGITQGILLQLGLALARHQLLKVRIRAANRHERDAAIAEMASGCGAVLISRVGNVALIYRADPDGPQLHSVEPGSHASSS